MSIPTNQFFSCAAATISSAEVTCPYPTCTTSTACTAIRPNTPVIGALSPPSSSAAFPRFPASSTTSLQRAMARPAYLWAVNTCKHFLSCSLSPHATCLQRGYSYPISSTTYFVQCQKLIKSNLANSFSIGYIYSFIAAGVFYWGFNRFFPHTDSIMDHPETGEDIIAANDAKNVEERRASRAERRPSMVTKFFEV